MPSLPPGLIFSMLCEQKVSSGNLCLGGRSMQWAGTSHKVLSLIATQNARSQHPDRMQQCTQQCMQQCTQQCTQQCCTDSAIMLARASWLDISSAVTKASPIFQRRL
eukprot:1148949-Pelagomonas_calceolata.AAC.4